MLYIHLDLAANWSDTESTCINTLLAPIQQGMTCSSMTDVARPSLPTHFAFVSIAYATPPRCRHQLPEEAAY